MQGREIGPAELEQVRGLLAAHPGGSRYHLSRELCRVWDWRNHVGLGLFRPSLEGGYAHRSLCHVLLISTIQNGSRLQLAEWSDPHVRKGVHALRRNRSSRKLYQVVR